MQSLNNPAMLQMLLQPAARGRSGKHGSSGRPNFINPTVSQALLQLNKLQQKPGLPGNLLLQNYSHLQMAQQQLMQLKSSQSNNSKPGLLGEAPVSMLQTAMGTAQTGPVEAAQRDMPKNLLPYYHSQHSALPRLPQDKQAAPMASEGALLTGPNPALIQASAADALHVSKMTNQTSLLGEPPRDIRLSTNPYLNLASVLPGMAIRALQSQTMDGLISQDTAAQPDGYLAYNQQYGDYSQVDRRSHSCSADGKGCHSNNTLFCFRRRCSSGMTNTPRTAEPRLMHQVIAASPLPLWVTENTARIFELLPLTIRTHKRCTSRELQHRQIR
ncbi:hypothetical protein GDO78_020065 [Eleutherodactylus coqui]|uniref:Uncharacterized protein n=1 Tax=Eleutherodactylus coqui TaxID=57060 RepID=A0A8J6EIG0_ELECQ|nr:hypothetical protein GDO78_020065 [Eleutherodactylus coqui]